MIMDPREPGPEHLSCAYNFTGKLKVRRGEPPSARAAAWRFRSSGCIGSIDHYSACDAPGCTEVATLQHEAPRELAVGQVTSWIRRDSSKLRFRPHMGKVTQHASSLASQWEVEGLVRSFFTNTNCAVARMIHPSLQWDEHLSTTTLYEVASVINREFGGTGTAIEAL